MCYFGPFRIVQHIGIVAYKLLLPNDACIHPMFHVSLLKRCIGSLCLSMFPFHVGF